MRTPSRFWFLLAAIWVFAALAWFSWVDYGMAHDVAAIGCGSAKDAANCFASHSARASTLMWQRFFGEHSLWVLLPALAILMFGGMLAALRRR